MDIYNCVRCGHTWATRKLSRPDRCAGCTRSNWWRPVRIARMKGTPRAIGRPIKYAVHLLNIGQSMTLPYEGLNVISAKNAIMRLGKRRGMIFKFGASAGGLLVTRAL